MVSEENLMVFCKFGMFIAKNHIISEFVGKPILAMAFQFPKIRKTYVQNVYSPVVISQNDKKLRVSPENIGVKC